MKKFALVAAAGLVAATFGGATAFAQDASSQASSSEDASTTFATVDADSSGSITLEEAQASNPAVTQALFDQADANSDGTLSDVEYTALLDLLVAANTGTTMSTDASSSAM